MIALVIVYVFFAYCLGAIARKTGHGDKAWWGWIPILQVLLVIRSAGLPWWWILLFLVPFVNIAVAIYVWIKVAMALNKHWIFGVLMVVPGVDLFVLAYLAFSKETAAA